MPESLDLKNYVIIPPDELDNLVVGKTYRFKIPDGPVREGQFHHAIPDEEEPHYIFTHDVLINNKIVNNSSIINPNDGDKVYKLDETKISPEDGAGGPMGGRRKSRRNRKQTNRKKNGLRRRYSKRV